MIIGGAFDGDNGHVLQLRQHDRYGEALGIIAYGCLEHSRNAAIARGEYDLTLSERLASVRSEGFDHRTLQSAHDYLAAWWRWKHSHTHRLEHATAEDWLLWLRHEVKTWTTHAPHLARLVTKVLLNQNMDAGYVAEADLLEELHRHYAGMPTTVDNQRYVAIPHVVTPEPRRKRTKLQDNLRTYSRGIFSSANIVYCILIAPIFALGINGFNNFFINFGFVIVGFLCLGFLGFACAIAFDIGTRLIRNDKTSTQLLGWFIKVSVFIFGAYLAALYVIGSITSPE